MSKKPRILIVEDEQILALSLESVLHELGCTVTGICISEKEALTALEKDLPDLILLDINLKAGKNGVRLAEKIRKDLDTPLVFMSGDFDTDSMESIRKIKNCRILEKPIDMDMLKETIEAAVQNQVTP